MHNLFYTHPCKNLCIFLVIIAYITYSVLLDTAFDCPCKQPSLDCSLYMTVPSLLIAFLILWMDKTFQKIFSHACLCTSSDQCCGGYLRRCSRFLGVMANHIFRAVFVGLLWVVSVFISGDWYVCCMSDRSELKALLACRDESNLTAQEEHVIAALKSHSKIIGFSLLFLVIFFGTLLSFEWRKCFFSDQRVLYDILVLEEGEGMLKEIMRKHIQDKLTEEMELKINRKQWKECFNAADDLMKELEFTPAVPEKQQQQQQQQQQQEEQKQQERRKSQEAEEQVDAPGAKRVLDLRQSQTV